MKINDEFSHLEPRSKRYYWRHRKEMHKKSNDYEKSFADTEYYLNKQKERKLNP